MKPFLSVLALLVCSINCRAQEVNEMVFKELIEEISANAYPRIDAVIIEHRNKPILEAYFNGFSQDSLHDMRSSFKSVTSLLAGIAIDQKLIALDDRLGHFFPELKDENKRNITIQNLLEMRSGLNCEEFYGLGPDCEDENG